MDANDGVDTNGDGVVDENDGVDTNGDGIIDSNDGVDTNGERRDRQHQTRTRPTQHTTKTVCCVVL